MASCESKNFLHLEGKVALITGASAGIGEACALEFARQGCHLMLGGRHLERLQSVAGNCLKEGDNKIKVECTQGDIIEQDVQKKIVEKTIETFGRLDILVNNAGTCVMHDPVTTDRETYDTLMKTNVESVFFLTQLAIPHLVKTEGSVINVSSFVSAKAAPIYCAYAMTKAALDSYTKSLALYLAPQKVRVNSVNPGSVPTTIYKRGKNAFDDEKYEQFYKNSATMQPLGYRVGRPSEVADAVVFLASERACYITGEIICIDGGRSLMGPRPK